MNFSIGLFAHNEEKNIKNSVKALLNQRFTDNWKLKELVIVISGSTDNTESIIRKLAAKNRLIKVVVQKKRLGKVAAVNKFLTSSKSQFLVLANADNLVAKNSLNHLLTQLKRKNVGLVCSRIIPNNHEQDFFGFAAHLQWNLHHRINLQFPDRPKAGELVAFRRVFKRLHNRVPFDEANVEAIIHAQGFQVIYCPEAVVYNYGPTNLVDFIKLRRRNFAGHIRVKNTQGYQVVTFSNFRLFGVFLANLEWNSRYITWSLAVMVLEIFSRIWGLIDILVSKKAYQVWSTIASSKKNLKPATRRLQLAQKQ